MKKSVIFAGLALLSLMLLLLVKISIPRADKHIVSIISPSVTSVPVQAEGYAVEKTNKSVSVTTKPAPTATATVAATVTVKPTLPKASENAPASPNSPSAETATGTSASTEHHIQIQNVPALSQLPELPNGCEAVAATMLLNWAGLPITKEEVADAMPKGDMPYENESGAFVGGNPKDVFVGDPYEAGYGIYHTPIAKMMNQWLPGHVRDLTGTSFEDLLHVLSQGSPAMVWATEHMDTPYEDLEWEDEDGELVEWYQPEHALLLTGWDDDYAYMNDPMTGEQEAYPLEDFHKVWELMGSQAITIIS